MATEILIDCISEMRGKFPKLTSGHILILAGNSLPEGATAEDVMEFKKWLYMQDYEDIVIIGGNKDLFFQKYNDKMNIMFSDFTYLYNEAKIVRGLKIWGSPFSMHRDRRDAFKIDSTDEGILIWDSVPHDIDILVTHIPPKGILDTVGADNCGDFELAEHMNYLIKPKLHVFGYAREESGISYKMGTFFCNCSLNLNNPIATRIQWSKMI